MMIAQNSGNLILTAKKDITELPKGLVVPNCLFLQNTSIQNLPDDLIVGRSLNCSNSTIQRFGKNTIVGKSLHCNTNMEKIPEDLIVGGNLVLLDSKIKELPKDLRVGGNIFENPHFEENPDLFKKEKAKIHRLQVEEYIQDKGIQLSNQFFGEFIPTTKRIIPLWHGMYYQGKIQGKNIFFDGEEYHLVPSLQQAMQMLRS